MTAPNEFSSREHLKLAIFDVDKTFLRVDSFKWFCWFAVCAKGIRSDWLWRVAADTLTHPSVLCAPGLLKRSCLRIGLTTNDKEELTALVKNFVDEVLLKEVHLAAADRLRWHKRQDHTIVFLSASPDLYLNDLGSRFGVDRVICTNFLNQEGNFTGDLYSANCRGEEKRKRLLESYPTAGIDWQQSYGYGNSVDDVPFLDAVGNAVAVNPDHKLRKLAARRNWLVETWR